MPNEKVYLDYDNLPEYTLMYLLAEILNNYEKMMDINFSFIIKNKKETDFVNVDLLCKIKDK